MDYGNHNTYTTCYTLFCSFNSPPSLVEEFRQAVAQEHVSDLCNALRLHRRCRNDAPPEVKQAAIAIIHMLTEWFPQFSDWHEFVKEDDHSDVEKVRSEEHTSELQ